MKTYQGERQFDGVKVTVNEQPLPARRDLFCYSENPFEWGYEGDEPSQLALAILADCEGDSIAIDLADRFMVHIVAHFANLWELTDRDVQKAVEQLQALSNAGH